MPLWLCAINLSFQEKLNEMQDPTYSHFVDNSNYQSFKAIFYIAGIGYLLYLAILILRSYSELRSMPYFDMRLKFLSLLMLFVMAITTVVTMGRFGFGIIEDNFVANLKTNYKSSAEFMCFYGLLNFYLFTMAYVYSPDEEAQVEPRTITKDNPAFSMVNDSDSEVVYGEEDESRRPLNAAGKGNDYDSD